MVKEDVVKAVMDFFDNNRMYAAVNCTLATLIPKSPAAKTIKDLRPIACCATIYKIISKILTSRLSKVVADIVEDTQAAFVPRRVIHDSIIKAHELLRGYNCKHISSRFVIQMVLQKAHDTVEWGALEDIIREMSFPPRYVN